jgi:hypothetical protein
MDATFLLILSPPTASRPYAIQTVRAQNGPATIWLLGKPDIVTDGHGNHIRYTVYNLDGSIAQAEATLGLTGASISVPENGHVDFWAYHKHDGPDYFCDQIETEQTGQSSAPLRAILTFTSSHNSNVSIDLLVSSVRIAYEALGGIVRVDRSMGFYPTFQYVNNAAHPSTAAGAPMLSTDGVNFSETSWPKDVWSMYVRAKLTNAAGTVSTGVTQLASDALNGYLQFAFSGANGPQPSDPTVTIEVHERGFGGGRPPE